MMKASIWYMRLLEWVMSRVELEKAKQAARAACLQRGNLH
jgi:hypothetical protein